MFFEKRRMAKFTFFWLVKCALGSTERSCSFGAFHQRWEQRSSSAALKQFSYATRRAGKWVLRAFLGVMTFRFALWDARFDCLSKHLVCICLSCLWASMFHLAISIHDCIKTFLLLPKVCVIRVTLRLLPNMCLIRVYHAICIPITCSLYSWECFFPRLSHAIYMSLIRYFYSGKLEFPHVSHAVLISLIRYL